MTSKIRNKQPAKPPVTRKRDGRVKITSQGQISIPRQVMREAGLKPGDHLHASIDRHGRIVLETYEDPLLKLIGSGTGLWDRDELERIRDEWDR